jgi:hypothetical protein
MLLAGERSAGTITTYCPVVFEGQFNGSYLYGCYVRGADCMAPQMYFMGDYRLHETGPCGTCPDPIATAGHPLPADLPEPSLVPQADPRFSGILR